MSKVKIIHILLLENTQKLKTWMIKFVKISFKL